MEPAGKPEWWGEWTYYDEEAGETSLKENASPRVRREWKKMQKLMGYSEN